MWHLIRVTLALFSNLDTLVLSKNRPILNTFKVVKLDCEYDIYLLIALSKYDSKVFLKIVQAALTYISWLYNFAFLSKDPKLCH